MTEVVIINLIDILINGSIILITYFIKGIIYVTIGLVYLILQPIDALILEYLPPLSEAFTGVATFLNLIGNSIGWAISLAGLSTATITLIIAYYTFKLSAPILMYFIKLALAWYDKIKG